MQSIHIKTLNSYWDLLAAWTLRIIRARYQQSILGGLWAIIQPAATVVIFTIIFTQIVQVDTQGTPYALFSFAAMVPWTFFTAAVSDMVASLVENMNLVTKVYFPREILPVAALLARFVDFLIASAMLVVLMLIYHSRPFLPGLIFLPVLILIQSALALGLGLLGAALNVFYRDIKHIFTLGLQLWFYASPIIYPVDKADKLPEPLHSLYFLNPMVGVIKGYRNVLLYQQFPDATLITAALISVAVLLIGYWFFKRVEFQFADVV
ncbi:MAG TPA: ABC transporter permease [Anaerolineales bacterium]